MGWSPRSRPARRSGRPGRTNLWEPVDGPDGHDFGAHGAFDAQAHAPQLWFSHHARLVSAVTVAAGLTAGLGTVASRLRPR